MCVCVHSQFQVVFHCHYCVTCCDYYSGYITRVPDAGFNFETCEWKTGYYTFGSACSVVEIDCLTGDHQILSTDIVMDVGKSLNPAIDIGQIEGGFLQVCSH